jgi:hypothetical protein
MHRSDCRKLEGNLCDLCVHRLLEICQHQRITGILRITSWGHSASVQFEHGQVEAVRFRALVGDRAMSELLALRDGLIELVSATPISLDAPVSVEAARRPARAQSPIVLEPEMAVAAPGPELAAAPPSGQPDFSLGAPQAWPQPGWNEHQSQPGWPQPTWPQPYVDAELTPSLMRRLPPLGPALGLGLLGFMLLIMVAIQL